MPASVQKRTKRVDLDPQAVRGLFATMHDEGPSNGILVTTRGYGKAAYEFADGKPLVGA
jgi:restriction system protein